MRNLIVGVLSVFFTVAVYAQTPGQRFVPTWAAIYQTDNACSTSITTGVVGVFIPSWVNATLGTTSAGFKVDIDDILGDSIIIPGTGFYAIRFAASFNGPNMADVIAAVTINGVPSVMKSYVTLTPAAAEVGITSPTLVLRLSKDDRVRLALDSNGNDTINICHMSLVVLGHQ